jgi:putative flippase GtrA
MSLLQKISSIRPSWLHLETSGEGNNTYISCTVKVSRTFATFCIIGAVNSAIHFLILTGLVIALARHGGLDTTTQDSWKPVLNGLAFLTANLFSYFANSRWSFKAETGFWRYVKFATTSLVGLFLSITIMFVGVEVLHWYYLLVWAIQTALMPFVNFTLLRLLVFKHHTDSGDANRSTKKDGTRSAAEDRG